MNMLIFGNGYIGNKFRTKISGSVISPADITSYDQVAQALKQHSPDVVLNCVGKTGKPNVDWCEDHKLETMSSNVLGPLNLARVCLEQGVYMVHIGSGCVYAGDNGGKGFSEDDAPTFFGSFYSRTKIYSEQVLREFPVLQMRLRMPLDSVPGPRNFITKVANYPKVINVQNSISILGDFIYAATELIKKRRTGVYNVTNPGAIDHKTILGLYSEIVDPGHAYEEISLEQLGAMTRAGRSNCVLNTGKLENEGIHLRPVKQAVRETLQEYRRQLDLQKAAI